MVNVGLFLRLEVKPGKGPDLEARFKRSLPAIEDESGTTAWFAVRVGPTSYIVFDVFPDDAARTEHLEAGRARLGDCAELLAEPPTPVPTDVIAAKLPRAGSR